MHVVEEGTGTPVLALHGFTPDHRLMRGCLEPVFETRPGYRRLYVDLPGMGRSPASPSIAGSDDVLAEVLEFVDDRLGDEPFLLVGESWGGLLSRGVTRDRPGQVLGLALICPVAEAVAQNRTLPEHVVLRSDPDATAGLTPDEIEQYLPMAVVRTAETARRFRDEIRPGLLVADLAAAERISARYGLRAHPETGAPYTRPTLILTGRQDATVGYADHFALLPHYPRATYAALDTAGHNLQIDQPRLFEALMHEWLDRVEQPAQS